MSIEDAWDEIDQFLTGDTLSPTDIGALEVDGQDAANRAGRALARLQRDEDEIRAVVQAERDRLDAFLADRMAGIEAARKRVADGLEGYARAEKQRRGVATMKLPSLTTRVKKAQPRLGGALTPEVIEAYPDIVRTKPPELDKAAAKKILQPGPKIESGPTHDVHAAVDADGQTVEGITFEVPRFDSFTFELRTGTDAEPAPEIEVER